MDKKQKATIPNRETLVVNSEMHKGLNIKFGRFARRADGAAPSEDDWLVTVSRKTGMDAISTSLYALDSKTEAEEILKEHPVGLCIEDLDKIRFIIENELPVEVAQQLTGDDDSFHTACYEALVDCGVKTDGFTTASIVFEDASSEKKAAYKLRYGENWKVALEADYVLSRYHSTSLAGYAAKIFFCYYITYDYYSVGYLWREMEMVLTQTERIALENYDRKEKASAGSAKASQNKKEQRIDAMLLEMESLVKNNPILTSKDMRHSLADLAIENAAKVNPSLWTQGKNQRDNYLSAMQTDKPFKERFGALGLQ